MTVAAGDEIELRRPVRAESALVRVPVEAAGRFALRAASNSLMPFGEARSCQRRENEKFLVRSSRRGGSLTVIEQDLLKFR